MNSQKITFWENVIISNKKIEPMDDEQMADYEIAEYYVFLKNEKTAA